MNMNEIIQKENDILRKIAKEVPLKDIATPKIQNILRDMKKTLAEQEDGVALAAPQIGVSLRIFVVSGKILSEISASENTKKQIDNIKPSHPDLIFINPTITKLSRKKEKINEGCLSVRFWYGKVKRASKATVNAYDENGKKFERGGSGILAQVFQHEIDHLNGALFTDKAEELQKIQPDDKT